MGDTQGMGIPIRQPDLPVNVGVQRTPVRSCFHLERSRKAQGLAQGHKIK